MGRYLRITIHDRDYMYAAEYMGIALKDVICSNNNFPCGVSFDERDLSVVKEYIKMLWCALYHIDSYLDSKYFTNSGELVRTKLSYFNPELSIVEGSEITSDNGEILYVPIDNWDDEVKVL